MTFPKNMLLCVEDPSAFDVYENEVGWTARRLGCDLTLFHSRPPGSGDPTSDDVMNEIEPPSALLELVSHESLHSIETRVISVASHLSLPESITEAAERFGADLVVIPTNASRGLHRLLFGSVAERVIRSCKVAVMTLDLESVPHDREDAAFDRIIVPTDFSEKSLAPMSTAADLARRFQCDITLVHGIEEYYSAAIPSNGAPYFNTYLPALRDGIDAELRRIAETESERHGVNVVAVSEIGSLINALPPALEPWRNTLIVMSTQGRDSLGDHLLGSNTERVIRGAQSSVLSLPTP